MYFLCFLSLASSQSSPERNQVSCCTGKETVSPNLARRAFRPRHLQPWVFYCVSWRDSTKQNPRRLLNAEKWLKIEHNNYHREQPSTRVGAAPAPQLPRWKEDAGQHREGPPPQREAWDLGSWLILTDEPGPCYPVKGHLEGICTPGWFQGKRRLSIRVKSTFRVVLCNQLLRILTSNLLYLKQWSQVNSRGTIHHQTKQENTFPESFLSV